MNRGVLELGVITLLSFGGLCLAWAHEADFFAMVFVAAAVIAGLEAVQRSL